jgi:hypothetical protein
MIKRSAPRPVIAPPTPAAKYSPPCCVSHLPAALESSCNFVEKRSKVKSSGTPLFVFGGWGIGLKVCAGSSWYLY